MITGRNLPPIAVQSRQGTLSVDLDDVIVFPPEIEGISLSAPVELTLEEGDFHCKIRLSERFSIPPELRTFFHRRGNQPTTINPDSCFRITGRSPDGTNVELDNVWPLSVHTHTRMGANSTYKFRFNKIHLSARGSDAITMAEMRRILDDLNTPAAEVTAFEDIGIDDAANPVPEVPAPQASALETPLPEASLEEPLTSQRDEAFAIVPDVELLIHPNQVTSVTTHPYLSETTSYDHTCFVGQLLGGTFCLEAKDGDVLLYFRRETLLPLDTAIPATQVLSGLLDALKFTHACQPWPYYQERRENDRVVERWILPSNGCQRDSLTPLAKSRLSYSREAQNLFVCAAEYFARDTDAARTTSRALWLLHEACKSGMPYELRLITLCSIYEGLIHGLESSLLSETERARTVHRVQKWQMIFQRLNLPWDGVFEHVFESWEFYRHPLSHGFQERTADSADRTFAAYSRITAAIYMLMAKDMGFEGHMEKSMLEDTELVHIH